MFHVMLKKYQYLVTIVFSLLSLATSQANASPFYAGIDVMRTSVSVDSTNFVLMLPKVKVGYMFTPQVMLELQYAGSGDDDKDNSNLEIDNISSAYLRLGSPASSQLRAYIVLGYTNTSLKLTGQNGINDNYDGFSGGLILEYHVWTKSNFVTAEYNSFYNNDDVSISAFSVGYRYIF